MTSKSNNLELIMIFPTSIEYLHPYEPSQRYKTNSNNVSFIEPYEYPEPVVLETKVSSDQNGHTDQNDQSVQDDEILNDDHSKHSNHSNYKQIIDNLPNTKDSQIYELLSSPNTEDTSAQNTNQILSPPLPIPSMVPTSKLLTIAGLKEKHIELIKQSERGISINQENYVKDLLKKYDINGLSVKTPMVPPNNLGPDLNGKSVNDTQFRGFDLKGYFDSDYARCNMDTKSTLAEYVAADAGCCTNILWMKSQLTDYDIIYEKVPIFCDNTSAIAILNNPVLHSRTKHIDIRYHFIKDHILKGDIELYFIPTQYQLVDTFTKPLDDPMFKRLIVELGMLNIDSKPKPSVLTKKTEGLVLLSN
ncbi:hypothetical protein Tco_0465098 [Tanacetum coccineum]